MEASDTCVICLSAISERAITSCNHSAFDFLCLVSWLQQRSTCPLCKAEVSTVTYQYSSSTDFKTYHVRPTNTPSATTQRTPSHRDSTLPRRRHVHRHPYLPPGRDVAILRRRHVYRHKLYSAYVGSNHLSRYQNITPQRVASSPELQSRARMFLRRELRVFRFLYSEPSSTPAEAATTSSHAEFLLTYIVQILKTYELKASDGRAEDMLQEILGRENARLFLHELNSWLRSPYSKLEEWDRHVQYSEPMPDDFDQDGRPVWAAKITQPSHALRTPPMPQEPH